MLLFEDIEPTFKDTKPFRSQLLKWIGNKQRFAHEIVSFFPPRFKTYFEPFIGSGAVIGTLAKKPSVGADNFLPLIQIWQMLVKSPETLKKWYSERWHQMTNGQKRVEYQRIRASYNSNPNPADLLFLCRSCYGGVVRFRQADGYMSTPCGVHNPISPEAFAKRVDKWYRRVGSATFLHMDYRETMGMAKKGDLVYCDPPYKHSQSILYGAQNFSFQDLLSTIAECKERGVYVALSIDGSKRSGKIKCDLPIGEGLFEKEVFVDCGRSMLKRFQMDGLTLEQEVVHDRLLLTY